MKKITSIIAIVALSSGLFAYDINNRVERESLSHNKRIQILQDADTCIKNAQNIEDYKKCEAIEKQSRKDFRGKMKNMNFSDAKAEILSKIDDRMGKLQKSKACVENAQSKEDLKTCKPKRDGKRGKNMGKMDGMDSRNQGDFQRPMRNH